MLPSELASHEIEGIEPPVIAGQEQTPVRGHRREPHGALGVKPPPDEPRSGIQGVHGVVAGTPEEHRVADEDRLKRKVVLDPLRPDPGTSRGRPRMKDPTLSQLVGDGLARVARTGRISSVGRPVPGADGRRAREQQREQQPHEESHDRRVQGGEEVRSGPVAWPCQGCITLAEILSYSRSSFKGNATRQTQAAVASRAETPNAQDGPAGP